MKKRSRTQRRRRFRRAVLTALRRTFPHLGRLTPSLSARLAEEIFLRPPRQNLMRREERLLGEARFSRTAFDGGTLPTWIWGSGEPVLLVHGWGGHAGRLTPFVEPLLAAGLSAIAFDAPGHGQALGRYSGLPEFVAAIHAIAETHGPIEGAIGHSLGAAACALAARDGLRTARIVLLSPPAEAEKYTGRFARFFGIPPKTHEAMKRRLERRYRLQWRDLVVAAGECPVRLLVFHDGRDGKVPFEDGREIVRAWPNAELVRTRGLGHHRILRDPRVIARAVTFIRESAARPRAAGERRRVPVREALAS